MRPFMYRYPNTGYIVQAHADDGTTAKEAPQTYHALSCIACGWTHLVDPATGEVLVPRERRTCPIHEQRAPKALRIEAFVFSLTEVRFDCR